MSPARLPRAAAYPIVTCAYRLPVFWWLHGRAARPVPWPKRWSPAVCPRLEVGDVCARMSALRSLPKWQRSKAALCGGHDC